MNAGESTLRLTDYLGHMLEAASLAHGYVSKMTQSEFLTDRRTGTRKGINACSK
jgi:uncharacterized protein with HEPN domain